MALVTLPVVVDMPAVLRGLTPGPDLAMAAAALDVANRLPADASERILEAVPSAHRWWGLSGAREILRAAALDDPGDLTTLVALGLLSVATRIEVDRRRVDAGRWTTAEDQEAE